MNQIYCKRIYAAWDEADGYRVLVDRLWPRGISKAAAKLDEWAKDLAPSTLLRKRLHQGDVAGEAFAKIYIQELNENTGLDQWILHLKEVLKAKDVTFLTATSLEPLDHAAILKREVEKRL